MCCICSCLVSYFGQSHVMVIELRTLHCCYNMSELSDVPGGKSRFINTNDSFGYQSCLPLQVSCILMSIYCWDRCSRLESKEEWVELLITATYDQTIEMFRSGLIITARVEQELALDIGNEFHNRSRLLSGYNYWVGSSMFRILKSHHNCPTEPLLTR